MHKTAKTAVATLGAAMLLSPGLGTAGAQAAEAPSSGPAAALEPATSAAPPVVRNTQAHAWLRVNVRASPNTSSEILSFISPGYTYSAICWTYGQTVSLEGYTSSKWVLIDRPWPKRNGYVTAIALSGDSTGGVSERC
ncbi:hypothetical protein AB0903_14945 [Streptomyces sp. NPDC048389]|uniref:hypothetical protein n=1 Tax=Streptomyces sp. NPDC048389 TaxID=3154622 RepID=UPI003456DB5B